MKKLLLIAASVAFGTLSFAQKGANLKVRTLSPINATGLSLSSDLAAKGTAVGDTFAISHFGSGDTATIYSYAGDTGYVFGMSFVEDKAFAERYDVNPADSTMKVIGVAALFTGSYAPATTRTITFNCWSQGPRSVSFRPTIHNNGFPATVLASRSRSITQLGIGLAGANDTTKTHLFTAPTAFLADSFFVGYSVAYTWATAAGDTISVVTNQDGERSEPFAFLAPGDTTINNVSVTQGSDNVWSDNAVSLGVLNNLLVFPIVVIGPGTGMTHGITRKDFTYYGTFPNPAGNSTNVKIALATTADVTVDIMDMTGRQISTLTVKNLTAGEHAIAVNTSDLAMGQYVCLVHTSTGNGVASQLTIAK